MAWKCGGGCSSRYMRMIIPKKRLTSGISLRVRGRVPELLRAVSGHLQPERICAEVNLLIPYQVAVLPNAHRAKVIIILPGRIDSRSRLLGKVHFTLHPVFETKP